MYEVLYQPLETFNEAIMAKTENVSLRYVLLTDLEEYVHYNISLRAYTSEGAGPYSEEVTVMTPEDSKSDYIIMDNYHLTILFISSSC